MKFNVGNGSTPECINDKAPYGEAPDAFAAAAIADANWELSCRGEEPGVRLPEFGGNWT